MVKDISVGVWLKSRRRRLDLTQKGLAYRAGCSVGTIRKIEADERRPSRQLAALLAEHLDIPPEQHESFIAFARGEPLPADLSFPALATTDVLAPIPVVPQASLGSTPTAQPVKHNLPLQTTPFLGRESELATLDGLLDGAVSRLVTIVGPGGIGKTRLALAYAEQQVVQPATHLQFPNGLFFINLAPLPETERMILSLAETLGLRMQGGVKERWSPKQQLLDYLRNRRLLLLLDNFEHLLSPATVVPETAGEVGGARLVAEILQTAPEVRILVTSRERLNLHMEQVFPIEGLAFPGWDTAAPEGEVGDAAAYPAGKLFLQAARRSQPGFSLETREEESALARVCHLVGGMPLALELAASWVDTLSLTDIADELQQGIDILKSELRDMPERQRSIRATFDYSWQKLGEKEQIVFAQLSVFRGGFTRAAGQAVTGATLRQLSRLVNNSLIKFNKQRDRYQVHELLRQYGADRLGRDSELEMGVRDRHSSYYCQELAKHNNDLKSARADQAISAIEADYENVRLAWNHAVAGQDLEVIGHALESLFRFYWDGWRLQGEKEFEKAVADLRTGEPIKEREVILGRLLAFLAQFYAFSGRLGNAMEFAEESLDLLQRHGAREETWRPLLLLARFRGSQCSLEESNRLEQEGLAIARESDDPSAIAEALNGSGYTAITAGEHDKAEQRYREALKLSRQVGDIDGASGALTGLGWVARDRGRYEEALALAREEMSLLREAKFPINAFWSLAEAMYTLGAYEAAEEQYQHTLALVKERGLRDWVPMLVWGLGRIAFRRGDYARAGQRLQESLAGALEFGHLPMAGRIHDTLGRLNLAQGSVIRAKEHMQAALKAAIRFGLAPHLLDSIATVAELFAEEGDHDYAARLATIITNHPASRAMSKERGARLLTRLETELSPDDLVALRQRSRKSDLGAVAAQLLVDLETSDSRPTLNANRVKNED